MPETFTYITLFNFTTLKLNKHVFAYSYFGDEETESKELKHSSYFSRSHKYKITELTSIADIFTPSSSSFHFNEKSLKLQK